MLKEQNALALKTVFLVATGESGNVNFNIDVDWNYVYNLLNKHDLTQLLAYKIINDNVSVKNEVKNRLLKDMSVAVYRYNVSKIEQKRINECLNEKEIPHIFLKGAVIRNFYKEPWLRISTDIDVLVPINKLSLTVKALVKKYGYKITNKSAYDITLNSENGVCLEVHTLMEGDVPNKELLKHVWKTATLKNGSEYSMASELFYFYHIAHMVKHFKNGGCGIKPFIDLKLIYKNLNYNKAEVEKLLIDYGFKKFEEVAYVLAENWQNGKDSENLSNVEEYILYGGTFGSVDQRLAGNKTAQNKTKYLLRRIFMPYSELKTKYKILEKHKWLTPIFEVVRWFSLLNKKSVKHTKEELEGLKTVDEQKAKQIEKTFSDVGLN